MRGWTRMILGRLVRMCGLFFVGVALTSLLDWSEWRGGGSVDDADLL